MTALLVLLVHLLEYGQHSFAARLSYLHKKRTTTDTFATVVDRVQHKGGLSGDLCAQKLLIEYNTAGGTLSLPGPSLHGASWALSQWDEVELFTKIYDKPNCSKHYYAKCSEGSIVTKNICNNATEEKTFCLGGALCVKSSFRWSQLRAGERFRLRVPTVGGRTCVFEMPSGYVKFYTSTALHQPLISSSTPAADELAIVAAMADQLELLKTKPALLQIEGDEDECGKAGMEIRKDPYYAAKTLVRLAEAARDTADNAGDFLSQTLYSLMALHFQQRNDDDSILSPSTEEGSTTFKATRRAVIHELAADVRKLNDFKNKFRDGVNTNENGLARGLAINSGLADEDNTAAMEAIVKFYRGQVRYPVQTAKRRVLIFTCSFGGGHKSAATAVSDYLKAVGFETVVMDTTYDDHFYNELNVFSAKTFNDFIIKRQQYGIFNVMDTLNQLMGLLTEPCPSPECDSKRKQQFRTAILDHRPDLVVTVYHMELLPTLEVAKELGNLPVLHIATDMDIKMKEIFGRGALPVYPKLMAGIPFNLKESYDTISPVGKERTMLTGYPVRAAFLKPIDEAAVAAEKAKFVPHGTKLMLIMSGGGGQDLPWPYKLAAEGIGQRLHIVVIAGGNNELASKLRAKLPGNTSFPDGRTVWHGKDENVTVEVATDPSNKKQGNPYFVFEDRLALLMDMADVMLSKPGGGSTAEIAYRGVPAVFDLSRQLFHWEKFTVDVFTKAKRGATFKNTKELRHAIRSAMDLGRNLSMVKDESGEILNTSARVVQAAKKLLASECNGCKAISYSTINTGTDQCTQHLLIDYSTEEGYIPGPSLSGASWALAQQWDEVTLFTKTYANRCVKNFTAKCREGSVITSACKNGTEDKLCLGGALCLKSSFRWSKLHKGENVVLRVPTVGGQTCKFEMTSGYVKFYTSQPLITVLTPAADELAVVAAMAAKLDVFKTKPALLQVEGNEDECGDAAMNIRRDPYFAAKRLVRLAEAARDSADNAGNSFSQTLYSLMALHFQQRSAILRTSPEEGSTTFKVSKRAVIHELAADVRKLEGLEYLWRKGTNITEDDEDVTGGMQAIVKFYGGHVRYPVQTAKRRVLIFTCSFGGGHKSAATAVSDYLKAAGFETVVMDTTYDDHFYMKKNVFGAKVFNDFVIKRQQYGIFNVMDTFNQLMGLLTEPCPSPECDSERKQQFRTAILDHRPDLVVTVYHMELLPTLEVAKELGNLPVLHIATDMDIKMKEIFGRGALPVYPKLMAGIPFNLKESYNTIAPLGRERTMLTGYPVRAAFLKPIDEAAVAAEKAKFVPQGTKLMLIMSGGGGQDLPWPYKLAAEGIGQRLHIVVIAGGNNELASKLRAELPGNTSFPDGRTVWHGKDENVTVEVATDPSNKRQDNPYFVFEDRLALLMDMADVMLSKPGGGSTAEIAYRGVPAVFDVSRQLFHWEKFTVDVFTKAKRGATFKNTKELRHAIRSAMDLGRNQSMVKDESGEILNTSARVVQAAKKLLASECNGCKALTRGYMFEEVAH